MSPLSQAVILMSLLRVIRAHLAPGECATCKVTTHSYPYIETRTERGVMIASVDEDDLYALDAGGSRYTCDPNGAKDTIRSTVRQALNDAREEWS